MKELTPEQIKEAIRESNAAQREVMKDKELEEILDNFYVVARPLPNGNISINGTTYAVDVPPEVALKDQLLLWRDKAVQEAVIVELENIIVKYSDDMKIDKFIFNRIKELQQ